MDKIIFLIFVFAVIGYGIWWLFGKSDNPLVLIFTAVAAIIIVVVLVGKGLA